MDSNEFKRFTIELFKKLGFINIGSAIDTDVTGIDITMEKMTNIGGIIKYLVEINHQPKGAVKLSAVKILHSTVVSTPASDKGLLITSGRFSGDALEYAERMGVELIDGQKLMELSNSVGFSLKQETDKFIDSCFPISDKIQTQKNVTHYLSSNLVGFNVSLLRIEEMRIDLMAAYMIDYSVNSDFSTSVGKICEIHENSTAFFGVNGELIDPIIRNALYPLRHNLVTINEDTFNETEIGGKEKFSKTFKEAKAGAKEALIKYYTQNVGYYGANNRHYSKTCIPKQKDVEVYEIKQVYIPTWTIIFSLLKKKYALAAVESSEGITVIPSRMVNIKIDSGIKVYSDSCMFCNNSMGNGKFVCSVCGAIVCKKDSFVCKTCGKQICREHMIVKKRYLFIKDRYCQQCSSLKK
jgi:restriction system protein